jgi:polyisoprenoid-binding protein YceI
MLSRTLASALLVPALLLAARPSAAQMAQAPAKTSARPAAVSTWKIDAAHSELTFRIRHLVSRVRGTFDQWGGAITADPRNLSGGAVQVSINTASIDTDNTRRDEHLRSGDFFDAANHPAITFQSRNVRVQGKKIRVAGDLTIRGVSKPVVLQGEYLGTTRDASGKQRLGFEAETTINRHDFGVSWNRAVETGAMLGDDVTITLVVAAVEQ